MKFSPAVTIKADDVASRISLLEIEFNGTWIDASPDVFESWTGRRKINGVEHHGKVTYLDRPGEIYKGRRTCACKHCQSDVLPEHKPN